MRKTLLLMLAAACVAPAYSQISYIFRKDTKAVRLESGETFTHKVDSAAHKKSVLAGGIETPVDLIDSVGVYAVDVPLLTIELPENPEMTELKEKDTYLKARITLNGNGMTDDFGPADCKIKGRGNSTWHMKKKPYRIKFDKKAQVGNVRKGKNLVLLANYIDPTLMKNSLAFEIAKRLGVPYVNSYTPCLLRLNGVDKGTYLMTEKVGINSSSVDIDETKGILFEMSTEFDEPYQFRSAKYDLPVMVKDPDFADLAEDDPSLTPEQRLDLWKADFEVAEQAIANGNPETAFDIESFINYLLVFDIALNNEIGHPKSVYIHKNAIGANELYHFGPIWDFDFAFQKIKHDGEGDYEAPYEYRVPMHKAFKDIYESGDVKARYKEKFRNFVEEIYPDLLQWIDEYAAMVRPSAKLNGGLWTRDDSIDYVVAVSSFSHEKHVAHLKSWLERRLKYLCKLYDVPFPAE